MTDRKNPTIGILSQEISRVVIPECIEGCSYISAAYVKYLEAAGAHVVPILTTWSDDEVRTIFQSINGVFIPGGGASLVDSMFMHNVRLLLRLAEDANNNGDYFPIWGTCLGFEAMLVACGGASFVGASLLGDVDAVDLAMPAKLTDDARKSALLASASEDVLVSLATMPIKYHFHKKCVYKDDFQRSTELTAKYSVITYDEDRKKRTFVSLVEGKSQPFYGVQWHPEKVTHEYIPGLNVPRSNEAIKLSSYLGNFFVNEANKSHHVFPSNEVKERFLISNYKPVYTGELHRIQYSYIF